MQSNSATCTLLWSCRACPHHFLLRYHNKTLLTTRLNLDKQKILVSLEYKVIIVMHIKTQLSISLKFTAPFNLTLCKLVSYFHDHML